MIPAIATIWKSHDLSWRPFHHLSSDPFHNLQTSLKNPQPRHHSNNCIINIKTQHHDLTMSSSEPAFNKTRWGDIPEITHTNYDQWRDDMILNLSTMKSCAIVTGADPEPQPLDSDHDDNYDDWKAREAEAASVIRFSCSPGVHCIIKGMRNPLRMWNTLETNLVTAGSYVGRQDILRQRGACRPKEHEPLKAYITKLRNYRTQLDHRDNAMTGRDCCTRIFTSLPSQYAMILMDLKHRRQLPTPAEAMHDLREEETTTGLTKGLGDASTGAAQFSQCGGHHGRGRAKVEAVGGVDTVAVVDAVESVEAVDTVEAVEAVDAVEAVEAATRVSAPIAKLSVILQLHTESENVLRRDETIMSAFDSSAGLKATSKWIASPSNMNLKEWWKVTEVTATTDLATTGDCDPFKLIACALTAAPQWVIDSGASHHMCNDHSSFPTCKKLSHPIVIHLEDNNSVTAAYYGSLNVIPGYQVQALHTLTFRLSLLSINQLDLGGHTTIFQNRKCSIYSPSSCTLAGKLVNGIYIIVPATALLSSTTENSRKRKTQSSPPRAPTTAKTRSTRMSLTVSESRLWHRQLAHIQPTAMNTLIGRYKHDHSICTVCIQVKHKQELITVPVKCTTKPFELVHSDVSGPFFTLTLSDHWYNILFIDDYTRYISILLLPNKIAVTCTSGYQSFQSRVNPMGFEIKRFWYDTGLGEYDN